MSDKKHVDLDEILEEEPTIIEFEGEDGETLYFLEELTFEAEGVRYAVLVGIPEDEEHGQDCDCGCDGEAEEAFFAKIVLNDDGEEEYVEPTDEEFEIAQKAYEELMEEEGK